MNPYQSPESDEEKGSGNANPVWGLIAFIAMLALHVLNGLAVQWSGNQ